MSLECYPTNLLEEELKRRKEAENNPLPKPLDNPDFSKLKQLIVDLVENEANGKEDDDSPHWTYEAAINAVYGEEYWAWHNKRT
jgi:hypothetical protein